MKKGFTLIELLAVIVILAIIALIATPIVLNIINDAKESATLRSAEFYLDGVEMSVSTAVLKNNAIKDGTYNILETGDVCLEYDINNKCSNKLEVLVKGEKPKVGSITIASGIITDVSLLIDNNTVSMNPNGELVLGDKNTEVKLAPGLYDENDNLIASWDNLLSMEYQTITYYVYDYEEDVEVKMTSAILNVDENGLLTTPTDDVGVESFSQNYLVGKLVIDDSVTSIGYHAFAYCSSLTSVIIPNSVTSIGSGAFSDCSDLTSITIPNSVTSISTYAFSYCESLTSITIPDSVTSISPGAFDGCSSLTSITIPERVTIIGYYAFQDCSSLTSITIPESVTSIQWNVFDGCSSLATINYTGTQAQWNAISKGSEWDSGTPSNKVINYNYTG